ncbi:MAG: NUDIX domain-containing protein [Chloroflexota bacterium]|nr:NUDIX domain-containing protein [Chloroflexota bacterium]
MDQPGQGTGAAPARPRVGVKALVIRGGLLLCVRKRDDSGDLCTFPGGGQEPGETLVEAVRREFREEVGLEVEVEELLFVREYIGSNHEFAAADAHVHVVDHIFRCTLLPGQTGTEGPLASFVPLGADLGQVGVEWLPVEALDNYPFRPRALQERLRALARGADPSPPLYVGDVN